MKLIITVTYLTLVLPALLFANEIYVNVTTLSSKNDFKSTYAQLTNMDLKMTYRMHNDQYIVYSGPYYDDNVEYALEKIQHSFPDAYIPQEYRKETSFIDNTVSSNSTVEESSKIVPSTYKSGFLLGGSVGYSHTPLSEIGTSGTVTLTAPQRRGMNYMLEGGYAFNNGLVLSLEYLSNNSRDVVLDNYYVCVNYRMFPRNNISPYIGILSGYSALDWKLKPAPGLTTDSITGSSFLVGTQLGVMYTEYTNVNIYAGYKSILVNHKATIDTASGSTQLEFNYSHNFQIGFQYFF